MSIVSPRKNDPRSQTDKAALSAALAKFGWIEGRNLRIDLRFGAGDPDRIRTVAAELVSLAPELIVTSSGATTRAVQQHTQTIPIIFSAGGDPVAAGLVRNIARPEGNTLDSAVLSLRLPASGWSCSRRLRRASPGSRSSSSPN
jgi:putative ABC transport system substrate-binding protein